MVKCNICEDEIFSCEDCGDGLVEGDSIYCMTGGKHIHMQCIVVDEGKVIK